MLREGIDPVEVAAVALEKVMLEIAGMRDDPRARQGIAGQKLANANEAIAVIIRTLRHYVADTPRPFWRRFAVGGLRIMADDGSFESGLDLALDAGIRRYVLALREAGIETFESCQGGEGHAFPEPTVRFFGNSSEGYRAFTSAMNRGLPVMSVRRYYHVIDGWLEGPWWEMTFRTTASTL